MGVAALRPQGRRHVVASMKGQAQARAGKAGACLSSPGRLIRGSSPHTAPAVVFGYMKEVVCGWWRCVVRGGPRTTSRRHRPHSGLSLTHSTPGDHTLVRPPGHWLRLVISHAPSERRQSHGTRPSDRTTRQSQMNTGGARTTEGPAGKAPWRCRRRSQASRSAGTAPWRCRRSQASSRGWLRRR